MTKKEFWTRFILWFLIAFGTPIAIICYEYKLIKPGTEYKFTGWGLIVSIIIFISLFVVLGYILQALKWSMTKQVLNGIRQVVLPILFLYMISNIIAANIEKIKIILTVTLIGEVIAIPINPFPKWLWLKNINDLKMALKD